MAALICFAQSTQFLFQRALYREWSAAEIASAWLVGVGDLAIIGAVVLSALALVGRVRARSFSLRAALFAVTVLIGAFVGEWVVLGASGAPGRSFPTWSSCCGAAVVADRPSIGRDHPVRQSARDTAARLDESAVTPLQTDQQRVATELQGCSRRSSRIPVEHARDDTSPEPDDLARGRSTSADSSTTSNPRRRRRARAKRRSDGRLT